MTTARSRPVMERWLQPASLDEYRYQENLVKSANRNSKFCGGPPYSRPCRTLN